VPLGDLRAAIHLMLPATYVLGGSRRLRSHKPRDHPRQLVRLQRDGSTRQGGSQPVELWPDPNGLRPDRIDLQRAQVPILQEDDDAAERCPCISQDLGLRGDRASAARSWQTGTTYHVQVHRRAAAGASTDPREFLGPALRVRRRSGGGARTRPLAADGSWRARVAAVSRAARPLEWPAWQGGHGARLREAHRVIHAASSTPPKCRPVGRRPRPPTAALTGTYGPEARRCWAPGVLRGWVWRHTMPLTDGRTPRAASRGGHLGRPAGSTSVGREDPAWWELEHESPPVSWPSALWPRAGVQGALGVAPRPAPRLRRVRPAPRRPRGAPGPPGR